MRVGAHLSVSDGYPAALEYAREVGAECMQVFAKSPRMWKGRPIDPSAAETFIRARAERGVGPVFTHTAYLINLASEDPVLRERSIAALADELVRGRMIAAAGVVLHIGTSKSGDFTLAAELVASAIVETFERCGCTHPDTLLLLENTAGAGKGFGSSFAEFGMVMTSLPDEVRSLVGVCLDTCHAHAAGIDLSSAEAWDTLLDDIEQRCGRGSLGLVHANDCAFEIGSNKDRHAWIGDGHLGERAFRAMMCVPRLGTVCAVTEMPGEVPEKDSVNIRRLVELREECF